MTKHVWKTKDGRKIPIRKLTDKHLSNIIRMLEHAHKQYVDSMVECVPDLQGEMAQYYADLELNMALQSAPEDLFPVYTHLVDEENRRWVKRNSKKNLSR